jgi:hypothetical protein
MSALMPVQAVIQSIPVVGVWLSIPATLYWVYFFLPASTEVHGIDKKRAGIVVGIFAAVLLLIALGSALTAWKMRRIMSHGGTAQARAVRSLIEASQAAAQSQAGLMGQTSGAPGPGQPPAAAQAMQALSTSLGALGADTSIKAVLPDALKGLLPKELADMRRTGAESGRQKLGPMEMAAATGTYEAAAGGKVEIQLIDAGSYSGLLSTAWGASDIDQENDTGFKRTATYKGVKTLEEYRKADNSSSIQLIAAQRFAVKVSGRGVDMRAVHAALDAVDLDALGRLAH